MTPPDALLALGLPPEARVGTRVPKARLLDRAPTAAARRVVAEQVQDLIWHYALKPANTGVPAFADADREYLEIAVLSLRVYPGNTPRQTQKYVHFAIPYPVLLLTESDMFSVVHTRRHARDPAGTVLDGDLVSVRVPPAAWPRLAVLRRPHANLFAVYSAWRDALLPFADLAKLEKDLGSMIRKLEREPQLSRRVALNAEVQRLRARRDALASACLQPGTGDSQ